MSELTRFSVSLEADLLKAFDQYVRAGAFATRSEAIRQLLHESLTRKSFSTDGALVLATLTLVYEHHRSHLVEKLLMLQHEHCEQVIASLHVHIDGDRCLEVLVLRGRGQELVRLAETLRGLKGVHRGELTLAETVLSPNELANAIHSPPEHPHPHADPHRSASLSPTISAHRRQRHQPRPRSQRPSP
jgi:CopG family nickel-responsive transcriptional regulator